MKQTLKVDKTLAVLIAALVIGGAMIFASAAFGLLARGASNVSSVVFNHLVLGVGGGTAMLALTTFTNYRLWRRYAIHLFVLSLIATALVFIPQIGFEHGGGTRWLLIGGVSFQPSEALKVGVVIMAATYFSTIRSYTSTLLYGLGGFFAILALPALILLSQPDLGTLGVVALSLLAVYFVAGARYRDIALALLIGISLVGVLAITRPYVMDRVVTFFNPGSSELAEGYQIKQSLIAIGSGGILGRGFGQGIQKFTYLPEPMGDSIFAVAAEELGFVGSLILIGLFLAFALRGYRIATRAPDQFGTLLAVGLSTYLAAEAFINIGAMLGLAPLTGIPLTFISQGGSAMLISLGSAGILLSISRSSAKKV